LSAIHLFSKYCAKEVQQQVNEQMDKWTLEVQQYGNTQATHWDHLSSADSTLHRCVCVCVWN